VKVQNPDGSFDVLAVQAETAREAIDLAGLRGVVGLEAHEEAAAGGWFQWSGGTIPATELYHFTRLFATLTRAGIPILEALEMLEARAASPILKTALKAILADINEGHGLKGAFARHPKLFDLTYLQLMEVGEESGKLPQVLDRLTGLLKKRIQLRAMILKALTYPVLVLVLSTVVVTGILVFIVPRFKDIYSRFGGELPAITRFTLGCSDLILNYFPAVIVAFLVFWISLVLVKNSGPGKRLYDQIILRLPLFGVMFHTYEIAGFSKSLSMLVHSGITVTSSLDLIRQSIDRIPLSEAVFAANELIRDGQSIAGSFDRQAPWLPELLNRMVAVGEKSGNLPEMLDHVADYYEEEFNNNVETLASLVEPVLIVFLGVVIGGIVVSLYLPIFGMAKLISRR
jgi:type IV pilus assembly protein PilC